MSLVSGVGLAKCWGWGDGIPGRRDCTSKAREMGNLGSLEKLAEVSVVVNFVST